LQFRRPLHLSILTERRVFEPYGLGGGESGERGSNVLHRRRDNTRISLGSKNSSDMEVGVRIYVKFGQLLNISGHFRIGNSRWRWLRKNKRPKVAYQLVFQK
jgi:hypothetical protein